MITLLAFAVTLGIVVVFHEFGHFVVARICGVKVQRFSLGFGPVIAGRMGKKGTEWALSAIPLGGYVKMVDEREGEVANEDLPFAFNRKPVGQRMAIVLAGPFANLLLAILLYWVLFVFGMTVLKPMIAAPPQGTPAAQAGFANGDTVVAIDGEPVEDWQDLYWLVLKRGLRDHSMTVETQDAEGHDEIHHLNVSGIDLGGDLDPLAAIGLARYLPPIPPVFGRILPNGEAAAAGLHAGDRIKAIDGKAVAHWDDLVKAVQASPQKVLRFDLIRGDRELKLEVVPTAMRVKGKTIGHIGAAPKIDDALFANLRTEIRFGPLAALKRAIHKTWDLSSFSLEMMGRLVVGQASLQDISGPVTIADYAGKSAKAGPTAFISFLALISVSIGILNLLPIPLLDGGHLLYYFAEFLMGRPVPESVQEIGQKIGAALLATLMFFALFNDFHRLFSG